MVTVASSGIGVAVAHVLAYEGAHVALAAHRRDALLDVQDGLEEPGGMAKSLIAAADVMDREQVKVLVERAEGELGPVEVLVNCAGIIFYTLVSFPRVHNILG